MGLNNKPNSMKIHEFNPVIYPYKVWIVIDKNPAGIADRFKEYGGSSSQNYADGVWTSTGWTIGIVGGNSTYDSISGVSYLNLNNDSAIASANVCARFACSK